MEEIKETVVQVLDKQGVLAQLKAQLRACVFAVVDGHGAKGYGTDLEQKANYPHTAKLSSTSEGTLLMMLVREFLAWSNMTYALKVYEAEANMGRETSGRDQLCHQLGLEHTTEEPLLFSVLHRYLASGDPMASPRIAAKAKSSIAAKPGGHTVNISAPTLQAPQRPAPDVIKATHYPTPPSVPAAAAAAAAMHAGAQQQRSSQLLNVAGVPLGSSSPHSMSPASSRGPSPLGQAAPGETPQVSPRQLALAAAAAKESPQVPAQQPATFRVSETAGNPSGSHVGVPLIPQVAAESSAPSLQPSTSDTSIISEDIEFEIEDSRGSGSSLLANTSLTAAAVKALPDQPTTSGARGHSHVAEQHLQSAGLQSPGSSVSPSSPGLSLSVPTEANRTIFAEQKAEATPIKVSVPTEVNRKAFTDSPGGLISPSDNSTVYEPDSLSGSARSSPRGQGAGPGASQPSPASSPGHNPSPGGDPAAAPAGPSRLATPTLTPNRLSMRLPPLAPLQASPTRRSAEQIKKELREQDNWFDDTDDSADEGLRSPVAAAQTWKVHQGLESGDAHSHGVTNAAFVDDDPLPNHGMLQFSLDSSIPDEF